ncbi:MAG: tRNA (adenosine(37)-N6)-dimethylallyltransferase MiaA [Chloroflexi bacterium]|nr:tRNA (adenosine(37)-N6)-dimethylallyltransferase MiaA [Chloroflexota bacterium]MBL7062401.1 tRNA (adenosine(37)-N6)-dimethylallyltransferase MiaA [Dehalococcoidia bacterium]
MKCLVAVIGPTAVGKSQFALRLAQDFDGEIVNADSRQVYRYMDIGTAKPGHIELSLGQHHLIDIINPDESFSLAIYQKLANDAIENIQQRHKLPLLVGGSGLYIWSVIEGWKIPPVAPDAKFRHSLETRAKEEGSSALYQELQKADPVAATKIMPTNLRRIIRALEICRATGQPVSQLWQKQPPPYPVLIIGLTMHRDNLYRSIDCRVDEMIKQGLIEEVKDLMTKGYSLDLPSMSGIGYKQIGKFLQGKLDLTTAIQQMKNETHRFARHQYAWFHLNDARIHWLDEYDAIQKKATSLVAAFLSSPSCEQVNYEVH